MKLKGNIITGVDFIPNGFDPFVYEFTYIGYCHFVLQSIHKFMKFSPLHKPRHSKHL